MGYVENTLVDGEEILGTFKMSNKFKIGVFVTLIVGLILIIVGAQMEGEEGEGMASFGSILIPIGGFLLYIYYSSSTTITSRRVVQKLPANKMNEITYDKIESVNVTGNAIMIKGSGGSKIKAGYIENAHEAVKLINQASENYKAK